MLFLHNSGFFFHVIVGFKEGHICAGFWFSSLNSYLYLHSGIVLLTPGGGSITEGLIFFNVEDRFFDGFCRFNLYVEKSRTCRVFSVFKKKVNKEVREVLSFCLVIGQDGQKSSNSPVHVLKLDWMECLMSRDAAHQI